MANEEITRPTTIVHKMESNAARQFLETGIKAIHRVDIIWWIEQIKLRIKPASTIVDPVGRFGGILLRALAVSNQYIQATIHKENYEEWVFSAAYASPNPSTRETLWRELEDTVNSINKPWLVTGDFNDYTNQSEHRSFSHTHNHGRSQ
ncbi:hypothetical protein LOK49_LG01G00175 [Camellia lanceoleosa]|uniref:Uncharacterized protein n=1 Tax=Camellia lanceoleosa TaxID=1840588 RepID=A0ACC0IZ38_9ERIC|nr:hypothetical protein LOK49_LG01G00175 [Camellia lanceoleosa]